MDKYEYEKIQQRLSKKILTNPYVGNKGQVYEDAINAAKSILSDEYHRQNGGRT